MQTDSEILWKTGCKTIARFYIPNEAAERLEEMRKEQRKRLSDEQLRELYMNRTRLEWEDENDKRTRAFYPEKYLNP